MNGVHFMRFQKIRTKFLVVLLPLFLVSFVAMAGIRTRTPLPAP